MTAIDALLMLAMLAGAFVCFWLTMFPDEGPELEDVADYEDRYDA